MEESAFPLCAAGAHAKMAWNQGYAPAGQAVSEFEGKYGTIPEGVLMAMRSGWSKNRSDQAASMD